VDNFNESRVGRILVSFVTVAFAASTVHEAIPDKFPEKDHCLNPIHCSIPMDHSPHNSSGIVYTMDRGNVVISTSTVTS
jgi:hypothetical protein